MSANSIDDRRRAAKEKLAERIAKEGGVSSEKAHQKAAELARKSDRQQDKRP